MNFLLVLLSIVAMVVLFFVLSFVGSIIEPLLDLLPQIGKDILLVIGFLAFMIIGNIQWYRSAYVTGKGKRWHFWLFFITTIAFVILMLSLFFK